MRSEICNTPECNKLKLSRKSKTGLCRDCLCDKNRRRNKKKPSLSKLLISNTLGPYIFENGYLLEMVDLGDVGVKMGLSHPPDEPAAIIVPVDEIEKIKIWFNKLIGRKGKTAKHLRLRSTTT